MLEELAWLRRQKKDRLGIKSALLDELKQAKDGRLADKINAHKSESLRLQALAEAELEKSEELQARLDELQSDVGRQSVRSEAKRIDGEVFVLSFLINQAKSGQGMLSAIINGKKTRKPARLILNAQNKVKSLRWIARFAQASKDEARRMIETLLDTKVYHD